MRVLSGHSRFVAALSFAAIPALALLPARGSACGYHDNVSLARGALNWTYPNALYVIGAMSAAVSNRRLPPPSRTRPDILGSAYRQTAKSLERTAEKLRPTSHSAALSVSLVLVEPMLWTRLKIDQGGARIEIHAPGPVRGDLVVVTGESVIQEIANGRLTMGEAEVLGLVRLYGSEAQFARFRAAYDGAGDAAQVEKAVER